MAISFDDFLNVDVRVGTVVDVQDKNGEVVLLQPTMNVPNGGRLY